MVMRAVCAYSLAVIIVLFELGDRLLQQCQIFLFFFVVDRGCTLVDDSGGLDEFRRAGRRRR